MFGGIHAPLEGADRGCGEVVAPRRQSPLPILGNALREPADRVIEDCKIAVPPVKGLQGWREKSRLTMLNFHSRLF